MKKVDWSQCEVGNGWLLEDFRFNKEDKSIHYAKRTPLYSLL